jgi:hypothetical protein
MPQSIRWSIHRVVIADRVGFALITHTIADGADWAFSVPNFYHKHNEWLKERWCARSPDVGDSKKFARLPATPWVERSPFGIAFAN